MRRSAPFILLILALFAMGCLPQATPAAEPTPTTIGTPRIEGSPTPLAGQTPTPNVVVSGGQSMKQYASPPQMDIDPSASYTAVIRTNLGQMTLELFAKDAPKTVNNFVFLAEDGFYDGIIFHRVIPGFMLQGGDPTGTGTSGPGYQFEDEIVPALVFDEPGILAMANSGANTNGGQLGEAYIHGMNGIAEGVRQIRGTSVNQVDGATNVLVTSGSGVPTSGLVLSAEGA